MQTGRSHTASKETGVHRGRSRERGKTIWLKDVHCCSVNGGTAEEKGGGAAHCSIRLMIYCTIILDVIRGQEERATEPIKSSSFKRRLITTYRAAEYSRTGFLSLRWPLF